MWSNLSQASTFTSYFPSYTDFLHFILPAPCWFNLKKKVCLICHAEAARASASWLQLGEQTTGKHTLQQEFKGQLAGRNEKKKSARQAANTVDTAAEKADWNNQWKDFSFYVLLSLSLCMSLSLLQSVSSFLLSSLVLFYLWLPLKSLRLLHTYVGHKSGTEKDSGQEEREMENQREAFTVIWATV